jgi:hypothetical protein
VTGQQMIDAATPNHLGHAFIRFRDRKWADPNDYGRLSVFVNDGQRNLGPWFHLFARRTQEAIGERTPQAVIALPMGGFDVNAFRFSDFDLWTGPLDPADK